MSHQIPTCSALIARIPGGPILLLILTITATLGAQELASFKDGARYEGALRVEKGEVTLLTPFGKRSWDRDDLVGREPADRLQELYRGQAEGLPGDFLRGHEALARWCWEEGYLTGLHVELEAILRIDPDHAMARGHLRELARDFTLVPGEASDDAGDQRRAVRELFQVHAPRGLVEAALFGEKAAHFPADLRLRYGLKAFKNEDAGLRWVGARLLGPLRDRPERINPLFRRSLNDPIAAVRREAVRSLKVCEDPVFVRLFAKNLWNPKQSIRLNAADALAELGMSEALVPLVARLADGGGGPPRNHVIVTTQVAYVKDFDVEVAQNAFIADPIVDVVQDGTVLDVAVVSVSIERHRYAAALVRLTGGSANFGTDAARWLAWLESR